MTYGLSSQPTTLPFLATREENREQEIYKMEKVDTIEEKEEEAEMEDESQKMDLNESLLSNFKHMDVSLISFWFVISFNSRLFPMIMFRF